MSGVPTAASRVGRLYLAGPMTGIEQFNFPAFNAAAAVLRAEGFEVFNPADHGGEPGVEWGDYLRIDLAKLVHCETIALLPGWQWSKGARLELHVAQALGMVVRPLEGAAAPRPLSVDFTAIAIERAEVRAETLELLAAAERDGVERVRFTPGGAERQAAALREPDVNA